MSSKCYAPWFLVSKPCEQTFRAARSMSNVFSTMINFGVLGLLQRIHILQIQVNLESKSNITRIVYPRQLAHQKTEANNSIFPVNSITNAEIEEAVKKGLLRAKEAIEELGMKDDLTNKQWEIVIGDVSCEIEVNDGEDMVEVDEVAIDFKMSKYNSEPTESNDLRTIPPEEIHETVEAITLLEVIKKV